MIPGMDTNQKMGNKLWLHCQRHGEDEDTKEEEQLTPGDWGPYLPMDIRRTGSIQRRAGGISESKARQLLAIQEELNNKKSELEQAKEEQSHTQALLKVLQEQLKGTKDLVETNGHSHEDANAQVLLMDMDATWGGGPIPQPLSVNTDQSIH
ncbi:hypothetical protein A6R68_21948, partial [Neotoma lepida]